MHLSKCLLTALILVMIPVVVLAQEWPMFHHDIALSGVTTSRAPDTNHILWTYNTGAPIASSPAVAGGKVYIGNQSGRVVALDQYTGALVWSFSAGGIVQSSPAVADGKVYFLAGRGNFYARNAADGTPVWQVNLGIGGPWDWASPAVHDGNVFIASSTGYAYSLNAATGAQNWRTGIGGTPDSPIAIGGGMVFSGTHNFNTGSPTLVAIDELTGTILWKYDYHLTHGGVVGMVNSNGAAVVDADGDGDLDVFFGVFNWGGVSEQGIALNALTGSEMWAANLFGNSTSTPAVHNGRVFIGSDSTKLFALNASTGAAVWSFATGGPIWAAPAVSGDGKVCVGSLDHTVYCVRESDGSLIWSYHTGASRLQSSPALSDGILYVGNENGNVYAFGAERIAIDIHPRSCPNPLNVTRKGVLPVAIVGGPGLDVTTIDPSTVRLMGVPALRSSVEDVTSPVTSTAACACTTAGPDGYADLSLKFDAALVAAAIGPVPDRTELPLLLKATLIDGTPIEGSDCVRVQIPGR